MTRAKKTGIALLVLVLVIGGLWFYWERPLSLGDLIPQEAWTGLELLQDDATNTGTFITFQDPPLEEILTQISATRVTRAEKDRLLEEKHFQIMLKKGSPYPTMLYVEENGQIHVAAELDFDHWENYEGGEELYTYLSILSQRLSAVHINAVK